jgi:hypothetical protein
MYLSINPPHPLPGGDLKKNPPVHPTIAGQTLPGGDFKKKNPHLHPTIAGQAPAETGQVLPGGVIKVQKKIPRKTRTGLPGAGASGQSDQKLFMKNNGLSTKCSGLTLITCTNTCYMI